MRPRTADRRLTARCWRTRIAPGRHADDGGDVLGREVTDDPQQQDLDIQRIEDVVDHLERVGGTETSQRLGLDARTEVAHEVEIGGFGRRRRPPGPAPTMVGHTAASDREQQRPEAPRRRPRSGRGSA